MHSSLDYMAGLKGFVLYNTKNISGTRTPLLPQIRGMLSNNHRNQSKRKVNALHRLKTFEGVPRSLERQKRWVMPLALRNLRLAPQRDYCTLGRLSHEIGWKHQVWTPLFSEARARRVGHSTVPPNDAARSGPGRPHLRFVVCDDNRPFRRRC